MQYNTLADYELCRYFLISAGDEMSTVVPRGAPMAHRNSDTANRYEEKIRDAWKLVYTRRSTRLSDLSFGASRDCKEFCFVLLGKSQSEAIILLFKSISNSIQKKMS
ncbi:hypothetical protein AAC387_Pa03g2929 [Persea americana]